MLSFKEFVSTKTFHSNLQDLIPDIEEPTPGLVYLENYWISYETLKDGTHLLCLTIENGSTAGDWSDLPSFEEELYNYYSSSI